MLLIQLKRLFSSIERSFPRGGILHLHGKHPALGFVGSVILDYPVNRSVLSNKTVILLTMM